MTVTYQVTLDDCLVYTNRKRLVVAKSKLQKSK